MGKYTVLDDPAADAAVQSVLDRVSNEVADILGDRLQAIVLVGGFGRGEGGAYLRDGEYRLVNDLDLLVFVNRNATEMKRLFGERIEGICHELLPFSKGIKQIDVTLAYSGDKKFKFVPLTVASYEQANGCQVIFGDINFAGLFRYLDPQKLSPYDGTVFFRNRGTCFLLTGYYFAASHLDNDKYRSNLQIEMHKTCIAMGDSLLLLEGQYHFSYRERLNRFMMLKTTKSRIPRPLLKKITPLYEQGITLKLHPDFSWPGNDVMIKRWFEIRDVFGQFFLWYESERLHRKFSNWLDYSSYVMRSGLSDPFDIKLKNILRSLFRLVRKNEPAILSPRDANAVLPLLLFSLNPDLTARQDMVVAAARLLNFIFHSGSRTWHELSYEYLRSFSHWGEIMTDIRPC